MSLSPAIQALNFFVDVVDANMSGSPLPSIPPGSDFQVEDLKKANVLYVMCEALRDVLNSEQEKQHVSDETHIRIYSVFNKALKIGMSESLRGTLIKTIEVYWNSTVRHIAPHLILEQFMKPEPRTLRASVVRELENRLICMVRERSFFHVFQVYKFLDMCKYFFMIKAESLGAQWHVVGNDYRKMDWEKIPAMSPEELAICARLGQARFEGNLSQVLRGFLNERDVFDASTNRILDIWQSFVLGQFIGVMQTFYSKGFSNCLNACCYMEGAHKYTKRAAQLMQENSQSIESQLLCSHFMNSEVECNTGPLFQLMKEHLRRLSLCALGIKPFVDENSDLYRRGYDCYIRALPFQKGYDASYPPLPPESFDSYSIPVFRMPDEIIACLEDSAFLRHLLDMHCEGDIKGLSEAILRMACPQDEKFVTKGLEYLALIKPEPHVSLKQALEESTPAPQPRVVADDRAQQPRVKKCAQSKTKPTRRSGKKDRCPKQQKGEADRGVDAKITLCASASLALPAPFLTPSSLQSLDAKPAAAELLVHRKESDPRLCAHMDGAVPSKKKVQEGVEAMERAFRSLTIADNVAPLQQKIQLSTPASNQGDVGCAAAAQEMVQCAVSEPQQQHLEVRDTEYCLAKRPILHERVKRWAEYLRGDHELLSPEELSAVRNHSHPLFIARVIMANCEPVPFLSPTTGRVNQLFRCVGSMCLPGEGQSRVVGVFEECMDDTTLYHHFFRPTRQRDILALYDQSVDDFRDVDEQEPPKRTRDQARDAKCESEVPTWLGIRSRRFSLMAIDSRTGTEYTVAFPTPVRKK